MGGQAKNKKKSKPKRKDNRFVGLSPQERMKVRMHEKAKKKTAEKYSVQQLLEKTQEYMDSFDFEMAGLFCQRALDVDSNNLQALDMLGHICSELGDMQKAKSISFLFLRAIDLSPDVGHSKYMYLGQIHTGQEAVDYYTRGIQVLLSVLEKQETEAGAAGTTDENDEVPSRKDVSVAYCSLAEIYLTDLCVEEGAADKCREFIEKALQYHHDNPEALQLMASYLFSTERNQEGKEYLLKSVGMWLPAQKQSAASSTTEEETQNEIPPYESRITTAKLLIESEEYEVMCLQCVVLARSVLASRYVIRGRRPAWHFFTCVCVLFFLLNSAGGGKAMPGLYALQSLVSIIEEWYLQRRGGVGMG
uniref:Si:dkey-12j5.1 n=1 Tax=Poecilia reticulata TaxID=8081 RepID=A0A3P9Q5Q4_POERE